jgi:hypothetical protein
MYMYIRSTRFCTLHDEKLKVIYINLQEILNLFKTSKAYLCVFNFFVYALQFTRSSYVTLSTGFKQSFYLFIYYLLF